MKQINLMKKSLVVSAAMASASVFGLLTTQSASADLFDNVPHLGIVPIGMQLGDYTLTATGGLSLGTSFERIGEFNEVGAFAGADLDVLIQRKLTNGTTIGAELRGSMGTIAARSQSTGSANAQNNSAIDFDFDNTSQRALIFAQGSWGKVDLGYLSKRSTSVNGSSIQVGLSSLANASLSTDVFDIGARYSTNYGPHKFSIAADQHLNAKASYYFQRPFRAFNYSASADVFYANEVTLPAVANRLARSFGLQGGLQVDYGRLYVAGGLGFETFASTSDDQTETRAFGSLGVSHNFGRTTLSTGVSVSNLSEAKILTTGISFGGEFALSRGVTLVGGYDLQNARFSGLAQTESATSHKVSAGIKLTF